MEARPATSLGREPVGILAWLGSPSSRLLFGGRGAAIVGADGVFTKVDLDAVALHWNSRPGPLATHKNTPKRRCP